jgi:hypothetical protein
MQSLMSEIHRLLSLPGMDPDRACKIKSLVEQLELLSQTEAFSRRPEIS